MFSNNDHPENKRPEDGKSMEFLRNEKDVARLANHIANLTEHMLTLTQLISNLSKDMMYQKRAFTALKNMIIKSSRDDEDDDDYLGLN